MQSTIIINDSTLSGEAYNYHKTNNTLGTYFSNIKGVDSSIVKGITSISSFVASSAAVNEMLNNTFFIKIFYNDSDMKSLFLSTAENIAKLNVTGYINYIIATSEVLTTTSALTSPYYIPKIDLCGGAYTDLPRSQTYGALSGFSYVDLSAASIVIQTAISESTSSYANTTKTIGEIALSCTPSQASASWSAVHGSASAGTQEIASGTHYFNTTIYYQSLFA